jgi:hypothetical protein
MQPKNKINYNKEALQGIEIDDMEYVKHFKLNPNLAYTPELNDAILNKIFKQNVDGFRERGDKPNVAKTKAGRLRSDAKASIEALLTARNLV